MSDDTRNMILAIVLSAAVLLGWGLLSERFFPTPKPAVTASKSGTPNQPAGPAGTPAAPATAAHIHIAPPGSAGPIVVPLNPPTSGQSQGCATVSYQLAVNLVQNPDDYYVNVHNADFPGGALRGQLG